MTHVLVLMSRPGASLDETLVARIIEPIPQDHRSHPHWLAERQACEIGIQFPAPDGPAPVWMDPTHLESFVRQQVIAPMSGELDVALLPAQKRRKGLLISDMDSTMIEQECIDEIADFAGIKDKVAAITQRAMNGELDFAEALKERVGLLKGLPAEALERVADERLTLMPGARTLVQTMKANGARCILVSGGFTFFTARIAERIGFDAHYANTLEIENGVLTGRVVEPILGADAKRATLLATLDSLELSPSDAVAVGDGANDAAMIETAGLGVAYRPHPVLADKADSVVRHGDLTALLYLQGFTSGDFVTT